MTRNMKKYIFFLLASGYMLAGCEKKVEPIDSYDVQVVYRNSGPKFVTGDITLNPKDSIFLDFTVTSPKDMSFIEIQRNGVRIDTFRLNNFPDKKGFSMIKAYAVDSSAGDYTYRVLARDASATFMGDGGKSIKVTVTPDFDFWSYRILQVPDSTAKTNTCYYSVTDGKTYSYTTGAASSGNIDFGYYYDMTGTNAHTFYSLSATQAQLNFYDISSWTKKVTLLKKLPSSVNFVNGLKSAGAINTLVKNNMTSGTSSSVNKLSTSSGSNVIGFKTAEGKYGAILVRFVNGSSAANGTVMEVDVKVQK